MSKINYYTPEGLQKLKDQLEELKTVQRPSISQQIGEARDKGELSENAE
jgi:transcription elongation factor GreA